MSEEIAAFRLASAFDHGATLKAVREKMTRITRMF